MIKYNITPLLYSVNKYGTEQILPENTDSIYTCVPVMNIAYGDNSPVLQDFMYRKSGGTEDIETGIARIEAIKGNTIAWNQLIRNGNFLNQTNWTVHTFYSGTLTFNNGVIFNETPANVNYAMILQDVTFINGHKYYAKIKGKVTSGGISLVSKLASGYNYVYSITASNSESSGIFTADNNIGVGLMSDLSDITTGIVKSVCLIDLTLIYGAGNEPSTAAQFEADYERWFGKPLTYEPYDTGSLRNVQMSGIKTVGFNQWDEEWEVGKLNLENGANASSNNQIRSKNYIPVVPNTDYYSKGASGMWMTFYDSNKNVISGVITGREQSQNGCQVANVVFKTPSNCRFVRFYLLSAYGTTYNHDICINISNPSKNGTYEPYKENIASLPITTLKGKLNGEGTSVTIFPDGMKSAGNIQDEIFVDNGVVKAIKRVGSVDLGDFSYTVQSSITGLWTTQPQSYIKEHTSVTTVPNIACSKYGKNTPNIVYSRNVGITINVHNIWIYDGRYSTGSELKSALDGVELIYELAEPLVYELDITPQDLQKRYIGNDPVVRVYKGDTLLWEANNL